MDSRFPEYIGSDASHVCGPNHMGYLVVGANHFYRVDPPVDSLIAQGEMTASATNVGEQAHAVSTYSGVEVEYQLGSSAHVRATLHDAIGRQAGTVDVGVQRPGMHRLRWDRDSEGRKLSAGTYFVRLDIGGTQARLKAVVR